MLKESKNKMAEGTNGIKMPNQMLRIIYERRSVRKYKDDPVARQMIEEILEAGRMAPSAMNKQPWKFQVLTEKEDIRAFSSEISKAVVKGFFKAGIKRIIRTTADVLHFSHKGNFLKMDDPIFHGAPVVIFISSAADDEWADIDIGMCAQNMMLAAKYFGLDTCPVGMVKYARHTEIFKRLDLRENDQVKLAIALGYGDERPEPHGRIKDNASFI